MFLYELLDLYAKKRLRLASPHTLRLYRHSIAAFEKTLGHRAELTDLTDDNVENHLYAVVQRGLSVASSNKDLAQLTALWRFAHRNRLVDVWPNVRPLKEPERIPLAWLQSDLVKLFSAVAKLDYEIDAVPARLWWNAFLSVLLETGERVGAIRKLTKENVRHNHLFIPAEHRKGRTRDRLYPLTRETADLVRQVCKLHSDDLVFVWDRSETYVYRRYSEILKIAGLPDSSKSKMHIFRRTCASAVKSLGGDPTLALDHSSPRTTKRYLDPRVTAETPTCELIAEWRRKALP
jgi:integrase